MISMFWQQGRGTGDDPIASVGQNLISSLLSKEFCFKKIKTVLGVDARSKGLQHQDDRSLMEWCRTWGSSAGESGWPGMGMLMDTPVAATLGKIARSAAAAASALGEPPSRQSSNLYSDCRTGLENATCPKCISHGAWIHPVCKYGCPYTMAIICS